MCDGRSKTPLPGRFPPQSDHAHCAAQISVSAAMSRITHRAIPHPRVRGAKYTTLTREFVNSEGRPPHGSDPLMAGIGKRITFSLSKSETTIASKDAEPPCHVAGYCGRIEDLVMIIDFLARHHTTVSCTSRTELPWVCYV